MLLKFYHSILIFFRKTEVNDDIDNERVLEINFEKLNCKSFSSNYHGKWVQIKANMVEKDNKENQND